MFIRTISLRERFAAGCDNLEERLAKAGLASRIAEAIRQRVATAELLGVDQPKVSRLLRGCLTNFSAERLMHFLTLLGRDVAPSARSSVIGSGW